MAKTIKSLLKISMAIRNLGTLTNYTFSKRFIQTSSCYCNNGKDSLVSPRPYLVSPPATDTPKTTCLQSALKTCSDDTELFKVIENNHKSMSVTDAITALETLFNCKKNLEHDNSKIYLRKEFLILCEILKKRIRHITASDALCVLKTLIFFNVPTTSIIVQVMLQMIRGSVNHLSLQQIVFLDFLLAKCQTTPLVEALITALPIVYESNLTLKLDRENMNSLVTALKYLSKHSTNTNSFAIILDAIKKCEQPLNFTQAKSILWSLYHLRCFPTELPEVVNCIQSVLAQDISSLDRLSVKEFSRIIAVKMRFKERYFYHEGLLDACCSAIISNNWGFKEAIITLEKLLRVSHTQMALLDYIVGKCFEDSKILNSCPPSNVATLVGGLSKADYKPVFWDVIQEAIVSNRILESDHLKCPPTKYALHLLALDCYCPQFLEKVFKSYSKASNGKPISQQRPSNESIRILQLYQTVKTIYPQYNGPLPDEETINSIISRRSRPNIFPLKSYLELALGGQSYVLTNATTKLGHLIDHVIVMRKGGFPVAINNEEVSSESNEISASAIEDLQPPLDSQAILISFMPKGLYSINTQRMFGTSSMQIRTLETLTGYTVIPIQETMWTNLPETERIPYLMLAIKLKCERIPVSINS